MMLPTAVHDNTSGEWIVTIGDTEIQRSIEFLQSIKGVGSAMISTVLAELFELGKLNSGEIEKLVGVPETLFFLIAK